MTKRLHKGVRSNFHAAVLMKVMIGLTLASCVKLSHLSAGKACGSVIGTVKLCKGAGNAYKNSLFFCSIIDLPYFTLLP